MHQHITPSDHGPAAPDLTAAVFKLDVLLLEPTRIKRVSYRRRRRAVTRSSPGDSARHVV
jgi:hypothetical protein